MEIINSPVQMQALADAWHSSNKIIGFVPTMGFLHDGHKSLISKARQKSDVVVVSIFVNPTQFGPNDDLDKYPRDIENDKSICESANVDVVFVPTVSGIYPNGNSLVVSDVDLSKKLCGMFRPGHFDGVTTVMSKLLSIISPDLCFMGNKDAQQQIILRKMVRDLFFNCEIVGCPTVREDTGLALSSRNSYLSAEEHEKAELVNASLEMFSQQLLTSNSSDFEIDKTLNECRERLFEAGLEVQYFEFVDRHSLDSVSEIVHGNYLLCVAVMCGSTRLIDNYSIDVDENGIVEIDRGIKTSDLVSENFYG